MNTSIFEKQILKYPDRILKLWFSIHTSSLQLHLNTSKFKFPLKPQQRGSFVKSLHYLLYIVTWESECSTKSNKDYVPGEVDGGVSGPSTSQSRTDLGLHFRWNRRSLYLRVKWNPPPPPTNIAQHVALPAPGDVWDVRGGGSLFYRTHSTITDSLMANTFVGHLKRTRMFPKTQFHYCFRLWRLTI